MDGRLRAQLIGMMFLHYIALGAWAVPAATFMISSPLIGGLGFTPIQVSLIYSTFAFSSVLAPMFLGLFADQLFAAEKLMSVLYTLMTALLIGVALWTETQSIAIREALNQPHYQSVVDHTFWIMLAMMQVVAFVTQMSMTLTNVISLRNLKDPRNTFGSVRLFGTVAWIVAGFVVAMLLNPISPQMFWFGAIGAASMIGYCWFLLPHTPPSGRSSTFGELIGLPALSMLRDPSFVIFLVCAMFTSMVQQFYSLYANKFLTELGLPRPTFIQTISQVSEVCCMALFPLAFARCTIRQLMMIALTCWVVRNFLFATCSPFLVVGVALPMHGICYTFFFVVATLYVDRHAPIHLRASAQGIWVFVTSGLGALGGNWLSATITQAHTTPTGIEWPMVWIVPAGMAAVVLCVFAAFFREEVPPHAPGESPTVAEVESGKT